MNDFLKNFILPKGSPGLKEALSIIKEDKVKKKQKSIADDYNIPWVRSQSKGGTDSWQQLQEWFNQAQNEIPKVEYQEPIISQEVWESQPALQESIPPEVKLEPEVQVLGASNIGIPQSVYDYATGYKYSPGGEFGQSRLNDQALSILWNEINNIYPDLDQASKETLLANLVAVAQAESGMGGAYGNPEASNYKNSNYWNWFKGGDRGYDPGSFEAMAQDIVPGIGGYTLGTGGRFTRDNASTYTGNDNLDFWYDQIYNPAMQAMGY